MKLFKAYTKYSSVYIIADDITNAARKFAIVNGGFLIEDSSLDFNEGWTSFKYFRDTVNRQSRNAIVYSFQIKELEVII